jgi:hypothetical protein
MNNPGVRDQYWWGMSQAAGLAGRLGYPEMSVIELGVGSGAGLLEMEAGAREIQHHRGIKVSVYGFDTGSGLPEPVDYRDLPCAWQEGNYQPDKGRWGQMKEARIIVGDVAVTFHEFLRTPIAPIGFMAFDLDYYSSTAAALDACRYEKRERFFPRTYCYFDDILGDDIEIHCEYVGELLAIKEFNEGVMPRKMCRINGLSARVRGYEWWHEMMYVLHLFNHPDYCKPVRING